MLELLVEVDGRPLSRYGCDGVVCATPTGSTAYAFSAGGPVVWPEVEALLLVPISAHALFSRPLVTAPTSTIAITVDPYTTLAVLCCDGRRVFDLPPGAQVTVRRGALPVRVVRLRAAAVHRPAGGEVRPAGGGLARHDAADRHAAADGRRRRRPVGSCHVAPTTVCAVLEELRITGLGVIEDTTLPLTRGHERHHRRDRRRQDHGRDRPRPAVRRPRRRRPGARRPGPGGGRGPAAAAPAASATRWHARVADAGAEPDDDGTLLLSRTVTVEGRSRAHVGGRSVPVSLLGEVGEQVVAVHGQSDQLRLLRPAEQRAALDRFAGAGAREAARRRSARRTRRWRAVADDLADRRRNARERSQEADLLRLGLDEITRVDPQPGEDEELRAEAQRLEHAEGLRTAAQLAHQALAGGGDGRRDRRTRRSLLGTARRTLEAQAGVDPTLGELRGPARRGGHAGRRRRPPSCRPTSAALDADPARLQTDLRAAGRAARR